MAQMYDFFSRPGSCFLAGARLSANFAFISRRFNIRVYGILLRDGKVLLADELIKGRKATKFPGGGLEYGEGIRDCLLREFREELGLELSEVSHFYTTDFFVASAFDDSQVISVYYLVRTASQHEVVPIEEKDARNIEALRWVSLKALREEDLTLVIDRHVTSMLMTKYLAHEIV
jgi:8-oxo-dGTP diphosphatase